MKRTIALGAAWTASAAAAVGLGFLAVSLVDASASPGAQPVAATTTAATGSASTATPSATSATAEYATPAGTVYADCATGTPVLAGVPVAGWAVDDSLDRGEMEFKSGNQRVEVHVVCTDGAPVFSFDYSASRTSVPLPASGSATSGGDDTSGRDGGGHGADDGPGDDSSGRDGGGHGADG
jgi:hypothetical protein